MLEKSNRNESLSGETRASKETIVVIVSVLWSKMLDMSQFYPSNCPNIYRSCGRDYRSAFLFFWIILQCVYKAENSLDSAIQYIRERKIMLQESAALFHSVLECVKWECCRVRKLCNKWATAFVHINGHMLSIAFHFNGISKPSWFWSQGRLICSHIVFCCFHMGKNPHAEFQSSLGEWGTCKSSKKKLL